MKRAVLVVAIVCVMVITNMCSGAGELIINEYNAVGSEKYLETATYGGSTSEDAYFAWLAGDIIPTLPNGRIQGNGSDWIELVVIQDHLDIRGWQIRWAEVGGEEANGTDLWYGDGQVEQGILAFSQDVLWSDLRAGTIITVVEEPNICVDTSFSDNRTFNVPPSQAEAVIDLSTDTGFDPDANDWCINISVRDESDETLPLITSLHNVLAHASWDWGCGNDDWQGRIYNPGSSTVVFGPVGEAVAGWGGSGINSSEAGRLEANPSAGVTAGDFDDANDSSFGMPNAWGDPEVQQDFASLRVWYLPPADCAAAIAAGYGSEFDFNQDCYVNLADFAMFVAAWLDCVNPGDAGCDAPWLD